jgi:hypothetical protein|tara:strand:- start:65940 stop:66404 length:465 start_codon:yes stop_codon:yes gene_type:complete
VLIFRPTATVGILCDKRYHCAIIVLSHFFKSSIQGGYLSLVACAAFNDQDDMTPISKAVRERAWARARKIKGENPDEVRLHKASGITMKRESFGKMRNFGWTVVDGKAVPCRKEFLVPREDAVVTDENDDDIDDDDVEDDNDAASVDSKADSKE